MADEELREGQITVRLTHTSKVLFPDDGFTKGDLIDYYHRVAGAMLPFMADRPVTMIRFPDGIGAHSILQKNAPDYFPDWITRVQVGKQGGTVHHVLADQPATLVYLANQACIELHVFLSQVGAVDHPDQVIFDLDPPDDDHFPQTAHVAKLLRELLEGDLGLTAYVKTTGGKGLHVLVPLAADGSFDDSRQFARQVSDVLVAREPDLLTTEQRKDKRGDDRIYSDVFRNAYAQTAITPYGVRGRPGAPVATPLHWAELDDPDLTPHRFTLATVPDRLADPAFDDPWAGLARRRYSLAAATSRLAKLAR
jgi:bifunctional non-homologous end joining protein LigD